MNQERKKYLKEVSTRWKIMMFFFFNLPSCIFWGIRIRSITSLKSEVSIPYCWRTRNPFKSMYFAAQAGAAELSTGLLVQSSFQGKGRWAMYVTGFKAEYGVTAKDKITFICNDGDKLTKLISKIETTGIPEKIEMESIGYNNAGEMVSKFYITWSLKKK